MPNHILSYLTITYNILKPNFLVYIHTIKSINLIIQEIEKERTKYNSLIQKNMINHIF